MRFFLTISILVGAFVLSGCATIVSDKKYPATFNSSPSGATVTITNENDRKVQRDTTPFTTTLSASDGYFDSMDYTVRFEIPCYEPVEIQLDTSLDPWYWGNLGFGGLIGFLIVDPASGSMWEIDPSYSVALTPVNDQNCRQRPESRANARKY